MVSASLRHVARRILSSGAILIAYGACSPAAAEPIHVTGSVFIDSAGGDFPDIPQPIDELIYFLAGTGLPDARGEAFETSSLHGTHGGLVVSTPPVPMPLEAGRSFDLSTRATFTLGQAIEATWPDPGGSTTSPEISGSPPTQPCSSPANSACSGALRRSVSKACYAPPRRGPGRCCFERSFSAVAMPR